MPSVLITGGQGDLAKACAQAFREDGWTVHAPGRSELDVTRPESVAACFRQLAGLDVLIHNAGIVRDALAVAMPTSGWDDVLATHLRGAFLVSQAALGLMRPRKAGHILLIGSRSARTGPAGQANYSAAKAGLTGLALSLAREAGPDNIRVNVVLPGYLQTRLNASLAPAVVRSHLEACALGRFNTPENAARAIRFLATLDLVSGQVFALDSRIDRWV